jgi:hypothetical protein
MEYNGQALQDKYVLNVLNNKKTDISLRLEHTTQSALIIHMFWKLNMTGKE